VRVLLADFDNLRLKAIAGACEGQGHSVVRAPHGAAALELALEEPPDMVVCPVDLSVIDAARLEQILRGNPRTRHASFVFLVKDELDAPMSMDPRDSTVVAPWKAADVLERIEATLTRTQRFGGSRPNTEIEGNLTQISVVDLLEIFQMNRKSGTLKIWSNTPAGAGSIIVRSGQVVDASVPLPDGSAVVGEKALYRLLTWKEGRFEFQPGEVSEPGRIQKPTRGLLLEGLRQVDEWEQIRSDLPPLEARVVLSVQRDKIPTNAHPLTREVIEAVEAYRRVREVVDHCSFPDYQVLRVLAGLLARRMLAYESSRGPQEGRRSAGSSGLLTQSQMRRLREWAAGQRPRPGSVLKVVVAASDPEGVAALHEALRESPDFMSDPRLLRSPGRVGLGTLGHFPLGEGMSLRLLSVPAQSDHAPLWDLASYGMLGAIVLAPFGEPGGSDAVLERLRQLRPRGVAWLAIGPGPGGSPTPCPVQGIPSLALPTTAGSERTSVLSQLLSRLVP
jgi:CheY-like chemotaxis protein